MEYSVLMSVYQKEVPEYLAICLESLINQTIVPDEIVIVKDGKLTRELDNIILKYQKLQPNLFKIVELEVNQGLGKALGIGLNSCSHEIVARMDSDDICVPTRFEKQLNFLCENPDISIVGTWISEFEKDAKEIVSVRKVPTSHEEIFKAAKKRNPLNHMSVMFRKGAVINSGGYRHFLWNEDYYLWVRMLKAGYKFANIEEPLVLVRAGVSLFERRGGIQYLIKELELQKEFVEMQFITRSEFVVNLFIRSIFRILPNRIRGMMYKYLLREKEVNL